MCKFLILALAAAVAVPMAATPAAAQHRDHPGWQNRDRGHHYGRDDWRGWRQQNRQTFARGHWQAPFRYAAFRPGVRIDRAYYGPRYRIADPYRYHLPRPGRYRHWVRHYNDVLLIDTRRGVVIDVIRDFYW
ncbi:RcnB family protein [Hephaestia sp. GCM10023244]|uniref:RcnB family protein n=1 Tax=unclassified Hephaestia TaxID=2631281 RepID=UPI002076FD11|nr:RcnB family protein [Hephaestia sp. MAHUQ-44]MCM8731208.1 RcnB family protein [Hephaestia sp. MAHUQ-44]